MLSQEVLGQLLLQSQRFAFLWAKQQPGQLLQETYSGNIVCDVIDSIEVIYVSQQNSCFCHIVKSQPAAFRISPMFVRACLVSSATPPCTSYPLAGSMASCPEM